MFAKLLKKPEHKLNEVEKLERRYDKLVDEAKMLKMELESAKEFFNNAETTFMNEAEEGITYIDVAILNKDVVEKRYCLLLKELKILKQKINELKKEAS
ncbi:gp516 [Bacillus phage G]|uniref:Gp516 n=1 Tax=Bacillus phage G TaxID=2884420 RepID=G3MAQ7_9CAUD|nr:gp516 [Bacillus phage G]AEO93774.1 gp516 [Bacillus phage G]